MNREEEAFRDEETESLSHCLILSPPEYEFRRDIWER